MTGKEGGSVAQAHWSLRAPAVAGRDPAGSKFRQRISDTITTLDACTSGDNPGLVCRLRSEIGAATHMPGDYACRYIKA